MKRQNLILITLALLSLMMTTNYFCLAKGDTSVGSSTSNPPSYQYSIQQATSDQAQLDTISFSGFAFLTGNLSCDSFLPPGKVADFFGFQYLRDTSQAGQGHSTDFLTNAANNVLYILNDEQKAEMVTLAENQTALVNEYAYLRYPLMAAFIRQLNGSISTGSNGLSEQAVMNYSATLYELDAQISVQRATLYAQILSSLNDTQKQYLDNMEKEGFAAWPSLPNPVFGPSVTNDEGVLVMTYASDMFSWYTGNVTSDTYFCPERQADYFGGFYLKDAPAMGQPDYTISETITGDTGETFLSILDTAQKTLITNLIDSDRNALDQIVQLRTAVATELRTALTGGAINESQVILLDSKYGSLDGEISYNCAMAFAEVEKTLANQQETELTNARNNLTNFTCDAGTVYLYSQQIPQPVITNTNYLFTNYNQTNALSLPSPISYSTKTSIQSTSIPLQKNPLVLYTIAIVAVLAAVGIVAFKQRKRGPST